MFTNLFNGVVPNQKFYVARILAHIYGRVRIYVTDKTPGLNHYWDLEPIEALLLADNIKLTCTHQGIFSLVTKSSNSVPIIMCYLKKFS